MISKQTGVVFMPEKAIFKARFPSIFTEELLCFERNVFHHYSWHIRCVYYYNLFFTATPKLHFKYDLWTLYFWYIPWRGRKSQTHLNQGTFIEIVAILKMFVESKWVHLTFVSWTLLDSDKAFTRGWNQLSLH